MDRKLDILRIEDFAKFAKSRLESNEIRSGHTLLDWTYPEYSEILMKYKFTNPFRELDKQSWKLYELLDRYKGTRILDSTDLLKVIIFHRNINAIEATEYYVEYILNSDPSTWAIKWRRYKGKKINLAYYTNAVLYSKLTTSANKVISTKLNVITNTVDMTASCIAELTGNLISDKLRDETSGDTNFWTTDKFVRSMQKSGTWNDILGDNLGIRMLGEFVEYEVKCDIEYYVWFKNDVNKIIPLSGVNWGPGALRGYTRLLGLPVDDCKHVKEVDFDNITTLRNAISYQVSDWIKKYEDIDIKLHIESHRLVEQWLCEYDKLCRIREENRGRKLKWKV